MKIYCMSDIHGCLAEFEEALSLVEEHLDNGNTKLLLLGDYIHGGSDNVGVLDKIMNLYTQELMKRPGIFGNGEQVMKYLRESIPRKYTGFTGRYGRR